MQGSADPRGARGDQKAVVEALVRRVVVVLDCDVLGLQRHAIDPDDPHSAGDSQGLVRAVGDVGARQTRDVDADSGRVQHARVVEAGALTEEHLAVADGDGAYRRGTQAGRSDLDERADLDRAAAGDDQVVGAADPGLAAAEQQRDRGAPDGDLVVDLRGRGVEAHLQADVGREAGGLDLRRPGEDARDAVRQEQQAALTAGQHAAGDGDLDVAQADLGDLDRSAEGHAWRGEATGEHQVGPVVRLAADQLAEAGQDQAAGGVGRCGDRDGAGPEALPGPAAATAVQEQQR